jgi:RHH-type proline utilization regulon transcriptional repressor/proline dehydrogenase/delta 1-pyrroline-5-carboxylate dehydrogenase
MGDEGQPVTRMARDESGGHGHFVMPTLIEIDAVARLKREVFGPVLHVLRYKREQLGQVIDAINATGYGLTFGVHSRIDETIAFVTERIHAGNIYVNRNVIGAVVGVQPFGGMGLSGTGPKAGGPLYLHRLLQRDEEKGNAALAALPTSALARNIAPNPAVDAARQPTLVALQSLIAALRSPTLAKLDGLDTARASAACQAYQAHSVLGRTYILPGPTGESNRYRLVPRGGVWAVPQTALGLIHQLAAALASGNPCFVETPAADGPVAQMLAALPPDVTTHLHLRSAGQLDDEAMLSALLFEGDSDALAALAPQVARRDGAIVRIDSLSRAQLASGALYDLSALVHEQSISTNTAAAGGNAQLMTMG